MTESAEQKIYIGATEDGRLIAATNTSPYLCLHADTEEKLISVLKDAYAFWLANRGQEVRSPTATISVTTIVPTRVINSSELAVA